MTNRLTRMLIGSRYTRWGHHGKLFVLKYLKDPNSLDINIDGFVPADLSEYKNEVSLRFTGGGGVNPIRNVYLLAENLADALNREKVLSRHEIVRIFLLFDGDVERSIQSIDSVFNQTYEFKKFFIVLLTRKNIDQLIFAMNARKYPIEVDFPSILIDQIELQNVLMKPEGDHIQFVLPGDKLNPEMLMHMVIANSSTGSPILMSELSYLENFDRGVLPKELNQEYDPSLLVAEVNGRNEILVPTLNAQATITSALSRIMCRQKVFKNPRWISAYLDSIDIDKFCVESTTMLFVKNIFKKESVCRLNEKLVERGAKDWTAADLQFYKNICDQILEKL